MRTSPAMMSPPARGAAIGIDRAEPAFEVEPEFVRLRPQFAQGPGVERRAHVEDGQAEEAVEPQLADEVETRQRPAFAEFGQLLRIDAKLHVRNSGCARP